MIRTARVKSERGVFPGFGSTYLRRRQAASLFSRADQTFVIKIHSRKCAASHAKLRRRIRCTPQVAHLTHSYRPMIAL
jgi:hypothetical protein